jgi:UDP-N-acetylmuramate--alanine ligase
VAAVRARGHRQVLALGGADELAGIVRGLARPGDYVVCLGAGNITQWAYALPDELAKLDKAA